MKHLSLVYKLKRRATNGVKLSVKLQRSIGWEPKLSSEVLWLSLSWQEWWRKRQRPQKAAFSIAFLLMLWRAKLWHKQESINATRYSLQIIGTPNLSCFETKYIGFTSFDRALVMVGSMGSFEPMDFWNLFNSTCYHSQNKEFRTPNIGRCLGTLNP